MKMLLFLQMLFFVTAIMSNLKHFFADEDDE